MTPPASVGRTAFLLGFAGLLPQAAVVTLVTAARSGLPLGLAALGEAAMYVGIAYPLLILSFLGGMWWGLAMRQEARQGWTVAAAVVPSLAALALALALAFGMLLGWALVLIGSAILLTLPVDRTLVGAGIAPANWMRLRIPLSAGLGGLTILLGAVIGDVNAAI